MIRRTIAASVAALLLLFGGATAALAATNEPGHTQSVAIPSAIDWDLKVQWLTEYNAVGTSRTEPQYFSLKRKSSIGAQRAARSVTVQLKKSNGLVVATHLINCHAPLSTSYTICYVPTNTAAALLSDSPYIGFTFWTGTGGTGTIIAGSLYYYL
jgi:hypothetical protein